MPTVIVIKVNPQLPVIVHDRYDVPFAVIKNFFRNQFDLLTDQHQMAISQRQRDTGRLQIISAVENQTFILFSLEFQTDFEVIRHGQPISDVTRLVFGERDQTSKLKIILRPIITN